MPGWSGAWLGVWQDGQTAGASSNAALAVLGTGYATFSAELSASAQLPATVGGGFTRKRRRWQAVVDGQVQEFATEREALAAIAPRPAPKVAVVAPVVAPVVEAPVVVMQPVVVQAAEVEVPAAEIAPDVLGALIRRRRRDEDEFITMLIEVL